MFFSQAYNPETDIPDLLGRIIIITGANGGLGYESLLHLARHSPSKIYLCARSQAKYESAMKAILQAVPEARAWVHYLELDLASLASVKKAAETFLASNDRLDILMCNAGIMAQPAALTEDEFEIQFGTNHVVSTSPLVRFALAHQYRRATPFLPNFFFPSSTRPPHSQTQTSESSQYQVTSIASPLAKASSRRHALQI